MSERGAGHTQSAVRSISDPFWQAFVIALSTMRPHLIQTHPLVIAGPVHAEPLFRHQNLYINDGLQSLKRHGAWTGP